MGVVSPPLFGYGTLTVDGTYRASGGVQVPEHESTSPNMRMKEDTKKRFKRRQEWAMKELGVGARKVSQDIMFAAQDRVVGDHPRELLEAIRAEWQRRGLS